MPVKRVLTFIGLLFGSSVSSHALVSEDDILALHSKFLSEEQLKFVRQQLRGDGGEHRRTQDGGMMSGQGMTIAQLFQNRDKILRVVQPRDEGDGVVSTTTSKDENVVALLHNHVSDMENLPLPGIRLGDPLFAALFEHYDETNMQVEYLQNGVRVVHTGVTACGARLVEDHADKVSYFVTTGDRRPDFSWKIPDACLAASSEMSSPPSAWTSPTSGISLTSVPTTMASITSAPQTTARDTSVPMTDPLNGDKTTNADALSSTTSGSVSLCLTARYILVLTLLVNTITL